MAIEMKVFFDGNWGAVLKQMAWMDKSFPKAMTKALRAEAKFLAEEMKKELSSGGKPRFKPLAPMTRLIRKASGINSSKPGVATGAVLRSIKAKRKSKFEFEVGVFKGRRDKSGRDVTEHARYLEQGRPGITLELDTPSKRTGKTPRQWLNWLWVKGALKHPPSKNTKYMVIRAAPPRPFMSNVKKREEKKMPARMMERFNREFAKVSLPSGGRKDASKGIPRG